MSQATVQTLLAEYYSLDQSRDTNRAREILNDVAQLIDRDAEPRRWAAMRSMYAKISAAVDPDAAISAYEEALTAWNPETDYASWAVCHSEVGFLLATRYLPGSDGAEKAIQHLELALPDHPYVAETLALLYRYRATGDPAENWKRRTEYLGLALREFPRDQNPADWARVANELASAYTDEPAGDYNQAVENRIELHEAALSALGDTSTVIWADTCLHLAECYLFRVQGDREENRQKSETYAQEVLAAPTCLNGTDIERRALLALGRALANRAGPGAAEDLHEALSLFKRAIRLIDSVQKPELVANVHALTASVHLALIRLGEGQWVNALATSTELALQGYDPQIHAVQRLGALKVAGEGLVKSGEFERAVGFLEQAIETGERALAQAETVSGRLERIFQLADSAALLSYCCLKRLKYEDALNALEQGKARLWETGAPVNVPEVLRHLIPKNGAALFPIFAGPEGAVIVVARSATGIRTEVVWLPKFGKEQMLELQRGDLKELKLGGWLNAYSFRRSQHENWVAQINAIGSTLYQEIWAPLLTKMDELGVPTDAELIWFPQGGIGVFPIHACWNLSEDDLKHWITDSYAIRYAPSVKSLLCTRYERIAADSLVMVLNPAGDLRFSSLECAWVKQTLPADTLTVLSESEASKAAVCQKLSSTAVAHFSTHATFSVEDPFASTLVLTAGESLSLSELLPALREHVPAFVVLSACDTAVAKFTSTPDEFLGFPTAFLDHGARTVLATMWSVNDAATAILVGHFYRELLSGEVTPTEALRRSQNWLRNLTAREMSGLLRKLISEVSDVPTKAIAAELRKVLREYGDHQCPCAEPYFWAAFTISGQ